MEIITSFENVVVANELRVTGSMNVDGPLYIQNKEVATADDIKCISKFSFSKEFETVDGEIKLTSVKLPANVKDYSLKVTSKSPKYYWKIKFNYMEEKIVYLYHTYVKNSPSINLNIEKMEDSTDDYNVTIKFTGKDDLEFENVQVQLYED
jgi:hypothetical protein